MTAAGDDDAGDGGDCTGIYGGGCVCGRVGRTVDAVFFDGQVSQACEDADDGTDSACGGDDDDFGVRHSIGLAKVQDWLEEFEGCLVLAAGPCAAPSFFLLFISSFLLF